MHRRIALGVALGIVALGCTKGNEGPTQGSSASSAATATPHLPETNNNPSITVMAAGHPGGVTHCRTHDGAIAVMPVPKIDPALDCPIVILDMNRSPSLRGTIDVEATKLRRTAPNASKDECCYAVAGNFGNR